MSDLPSDIPIAATRPASPLGLHRVLEPVGVLPQAAERLDTRRELWPDEVRVSVERLNLDAASFRQLERTHSGDGVCSITSGYVVRDPALTSLAGRYLHGDFCAPSIRSMQAGGGDDRETGLRVSQLSSFGEDGRGRVYAMSLDGPVYRLVRR